MSAARRQPSAVEARGNHTGGVVPRVALRVEEAAAALGVSDDFFREHVRPHLAVIRCGRLRLYRLAELERWAIEAEERAPLDVLATGNGTPERAQTASADRRFAA